MLNYTAYIGHTPLRLFVMGEEAVGRAATPDEIGRMAGMVRDAMTAGAAGFSTSFAITHRGADGQPIPSRWAKRDEIDALCHAVGDSGRGVVGVNGGENLSFADLYDLQPRCGVPFTFTALLTTPQGFHLRGIETHKAGRARGADVWPQVSCRPLSFSMNMIEPFTLNTNPVFAELMPKIVRGTPARLRGSSVGASASSMLGPPDRASIRSGRASRSPRRRTRRPRSDTASANSRRKATVIRSRSC